MISEVAGRAGLDRGTVFRLINTLKTLGYPAAVPRSRRFCLTLKCLELGYTALARGDLKTHARPLLTALVPEIADAGCSACSTVRMWSTWNASRPSSAGEIWTGGSAAARR